MILSLVGFYSEEFIPLTEKENVPVILTELKNELAMDMNYDELKKYCEGINSRAAKVSGKSHL